jgi:pteridine reductase
MSIQRVALVTGAGRRIGRAIAERLAATGHAVAVHHRAADGGDETVAACARLGVPARAFRADLENAAAAIELAAQVERWLGRVDVLVHNASSFRRTPILEFDAEALARETQRCLALHVVAPLVLTRALAPGMVARGRGAVVALGDVALRAPRARFAPYLASKAALVTAMLSLSRELAPQVRVNVVSPGVILPPEGALADTTDALLARVPAGRFGRPDEVAEAVSFFVDGPEFITGQVLAVTGGE